MTDYRQGDILSALQKSLKSTRISAFLRSMKARWGSCIEDKQSILLNGDLIKAPKLCIDYVVLHELIHFKYRNHDSDFCDFMTSLMPDRKMRKEILDEEIVREL